MAMRAGEYRNWRQRHDQDGTALSRIYLDAAPLVQRFVGVELDQKGWAYKALWRAGKSGRVSVETVDKLCTSELHQHPAEVYGDEWWA